MSPLKTEPNPYYRPPQFTATARLLHELRRRQAATPGQQFRATHRDLANTLGFGSVGQIPRMMRQLEADGLIERQSDPDKSVWLRVLTVEPNPDEPIDWPAVEPAPRPRASIRKQRQRRVRVTIGLRNPLVTLHYEMTDSERERLLGAFEQAKQGESSVDLRLAVYAIDEQEHERMLSLRLEDVAYIG